MNEYKIWLAKILTIGVLVLFILPIGIGLIGAIGGVDAGPKVSVVEITGVIEDSTEVLAALYREARDKHSKAIVVRIDSPGGAVAPSEEIYSAIKRLKSEKPIVASMGSVAASGGLYASLGASRVFANRGTQTGSIGVIMQLPNYASVADKVGVTMVTVKSGALKDTGNPFRPMTPEERVFLETTTVKVHDVFIQAVVEGRSLPEEKVRSFADGRVLLGIEAKELGLVDEFGDIYDAARAALKLANEEIKDDQLPQLIYSNKKKGAVAKFLEGVSHLSYLISSGTAAMPNIFSTTVGGTVPVARYISG
jgi:protease-4